MIRPLAFVLVWTILWSCTSKRSQEEVKKPDTTQIPSPDTIVTVTDTFNWDTELCQNKGTYSHGQYSEEQLRNTYTLLFNGVYLETEATVFKPEDLGKLNPDSLEREYKQKKQKLQRLNVLSTDYWLKLKKAYLQELEEDYQLRKITLAAYQDPQVLLNSPYSSQCKSYAEALASNDTLQLLTTWKKMVEEQKQHNGSPEQVMERFYKKYNSPSNIDYAKVELMTFGWWNCANKQIHRVTQDGTIEAEFEKLFTSIQSECDEP